MAATCKERKEPQTASKSRSGYSREREFLVEGVYSPEDALNTYAGPDYLPDIGTPHPVAAYNMEVTELSAEMMEDDNSRWIVKVTYGPTPGNQGLSNVATAGLGTFSFDTGSSTKKMLQALSDTPADKTFARPGEEKLLSEGVIGWDGEKAQGVDIPTGAFKFQVSQKYMEEEITDSYILWLSRNAYHINDASYSLWDAGELLFENAAGRYTPGGLPETIGDMGNIITWVSISGVTSTNTNNGVLYGTIDRKQLIPGGTRYTIELFTSPTFDGTPVATAINFAAGEEVILSGPEISITMILQSPTYDGEFAVRFPFPWEINYSFAVSPDSTSLTVGEISVTGKAGWEYADVYYAGKTKKDEGGVNNHSVMTPKYVYLHKVFEEANFGLLLLNEDDVVPGV